MAAPEDWSPASERRQQGDLLLTCKRHIRLHQAAIHGYGITQSIQALNTPGQDTPEFIHRGRLHVQKVRASTFRDQTEQMDPHGSKIAQRVQVAEEVG
ncbi:MAG TPA: hypothetical protein PLP28_12740, partial [Flavobacteriales bacterium]|nr:hypothetical protein [Flavobacteriales bacterium]